MESFNRCLLGALLMAGALLPSPRAMAQDVGDIVEHLALDQYKVDAGEHTVSRACEHMGCTLSLLGTRWGFLNRYDSAGARSWRSRPLPIGHCDMAALWAWEGGAYEVNAGKCAPGEDNLWLWLPDNTLVSMQVQPPVQEAGNELRALPLAHLWLQPGQEADIEKTRAALQAYWRRPPQQGSPYTRNVAWPGALRIEAVPLPTPEQFLQAHAGAAAIWRGNPAHDKTTAAKAQRALQALAPVLSTFDWRTLSGRDIEAINDTGFWLQQTGDCQDAVDAVVMLQDVATHMPDRAPVYLNLADAQASTRRDACRNGSTPRASEYDLQENLRQYCVRQGIDRIPAAIARRIATALEVQTLDAESCRPRMMLFKAIAARDLPALQAGLAAHPEDLDAPSSDGYAVLHQAVDAGWREGADTLLQAGADPDRAVPGGGDQGGAAPLIRAIYRHDLPMLNLLLQHHAQVETTGARYQPLLVAADLSRDGDRRIAATAMVEALLDHGASVATTDDDGTTALMNAAGSGNNATIGLLLAHGASVNAQDKYGRNALHHVPPFNADNVAAFGLLLAHGANVNQQDRNGESPLLHVFGWTGGKNARVAEMVALALRDHANPELARTDSGDVALHQAAFSGNLPAVQALLDGGAAHCPANKSGATPADRVRKQQDNVVNDGKYACQSDAMRECPRLEDLQRILDLLDCPAAPAT